MTQLPMTVISGYLGAGKTTFLNRLLSAPEDVRYGVLVNDFGDIAIDERLIRNQTGGVIALSNGCVCCAIDGDLYAALDGLLSGADRPDHLVLEASGVADPGKLAQIAEAEPELRNAGILTLVDARNIERQLADPHLRDSVLRQITCADRIALSKADLVGADAALSLTMDLARLTGQDAIAIAGEGPAAHLLPGRGQTPQDAPAHGHAHYTSWSYRGPAALPLEAWRDTVCGPGDVLRMKGFLNTPDGPRYVVHLAGDHWDAAEAPDGPTELVVIGLQDRLRTRRFAEVFP